MTKPNCLTAFLFAVIIGRATAQSTDALQQKIQHIVSTKNATVGVSIIGPNAKDTLTFHGDGHFPMQSVFKLHIGLAMLSQVDKGAFSLTQKITIDKKDLLPDLYSPLRDKYPNGGALPLAEILEYTVAESDNVGCEVLLRLLGGAQAVEKYFHQNGLKDVSIKFNEEQQQGNWELQFQNWTTPKAANQVLAAFYYNKAKLLSPKSHAFIWKVMRESKTGLKRLKGQLPPGTVVAHKTGSSGTDKAGLTAAVNDIGIVFLPSEKPLFISVLVTNSNENTETNEKIIADIAKATWDYFVK